MMRRHYAAHLFDFVWSCYAFHGRADGMGGSQYRRSWQEFELACRTVKMSKIGTVDIWIRAWLKNDDMAMSMVENAVKQGETSNG